MTSNDKIVRIGTRGSFLARTQTEQVVNELRQQRPDLSFKIITITTTGDRHTDGRLSPALGKGLFTKEIEDAISANEVDLAVHSLKDLPTEFPDGLALGAITKREDPRDAVVGKSPDLTPWGDGLIIGTSSLRRISQLKAINSDCEVTDLRGNIDTRLRKVKEGVVDSAILAVAGLRRLGLADKITKILDPDMMLPAPGQGALGIEVRDNDERIQSLVGLLHCYDTSLCVSAERTLLQHLGGGCQVPVAALATINGDDLILEARVLSLDGARIVADSATDHRNNAVAIGQHLAETLLDKGAGKILEEIVDDSSRSNIDG